MKAHTSKKVGREVLTHDLKPAGRKYQICYMFYTRDQLLRAYHHGLGCQSERGT